ncbi:radical SAM/SPASM domain-containing protein [Anaeromicropila populeti]|uniref:Radical SAM superfamily enzyme, MoaA/NifB/PqqE/SkfB family n=1 Tax=Anaeromicropila populeti TaxID=37658 RepID=A0A1I6L225_9FIRM|nr:radical SAM/SPASM domain-containing protein [Anaeromicropila populeti]SFR97260.1 Radical SAM superfamily enzyme, MoaA/NifB/PqqE/SkfB family [Anaeromicropila populeti]
MKLPEGFTTEEQYQFPSILNVCIFKGACPANCVHCPVGKTEQSKRKDAFGSEAMKMEVFKKIVDEISGYPQSTLRIHSVGEPLLWEDLTNALTYAKSKGVRTWIFTSAITHQKDLLRMIVETCDIVEVSINSYEEGDYQETKGVDAYCLVAENVEYMSKVIREKNLHTRLLVSRVESDDKEYDQNFISYWEKTNLVTDTFVRSYHSYNSLIEDRIKREKTVACHVHWGRFNIDTNGEVVVCFNELFKGPNVDRNLIIGDTKTQTIEEIWHGDKLNKIRRSQLENKPDLVDFTDNLPCNNCTYCQPLFSDTVKSENQISQLVNK